MIHTKTSFSDSTRPLRFYTTIPCLSNARCRSVVLIQFVRRSTRSPVPHNLLVILSPLLRDGETFLVHRVWGRRLGISGFFLLFKPSLKQAVEGFRVIQRFLQTTRGEYTRHHLFRSPSVSSPFLYIFCHSAPRTAEYSRSGSASWFCSAIVC